MTAGAVRRPGTGRLIGGVCAGIGEQIGVDPVALRVIAVILGALGAGVPLYALAWIVLPGPDGRPGRIHPGRPLRALLVLLIAALVGGIAASATLELLARGTGVGLPGELQPALFLILLGLGALWWREAALNPAADPVDSAPTDRSVPPPALAPPISPRPGDALFAPIVVVLAAIVGVLPMLLPAGWGVDIAWDESLAAAVVVLGMGLVAGAFFHRGAWLIPIGALAALALVVVAVSGSDFRGGAGERVLSPQRAAALPAEFRLAAGSAEIDLRRLDLMGQNVTLDARVAAGELVVRLPPDANAVVNLRAGFGELRLEPGEREPVRASFVGEDPLPDTQEPQAIDGVSVEGSLELAGSGGRIEIQAEVGFGQVRVIW